LVVRWEASRRHNTCYQGIVILENTPAIISFVLYFGLKTSEAVGKEEGDGEATRGYLYIRTHTQDPVIELWVENFRLPALSQIP
jgi:hypothetical protein